MASLRKRLLVVILCYCTFVWKTTVWREPKAQRKKNQPHEEASLLSSSQDQDQFSFSNAKRRRIDSYSYSWKGELDLHPFPLSQCTTFRFRGHNASLSLEQARQFLQQQQQQQQQVTGSLERPLRIGWTFVEEPDEFVSLGKTSHMHLFHFIEFVVVAYAQLARLSSLTDSTSWPQFRVPWVYVPHLTVSEICGVAHGLNCLILALLWDQDNDNDNNWQHSERWARGLEVNDARTVLEHSAYAGYLTKRERLRLQTGENETWTDSSSFLTSSLLLSSSSAAERTRSAMQDQADAVLLVHRVHCKHVSGRDANIHKIWTTFIDDFPAPQWSAAVRRRLGPWQDTTNNNDNKSQLTVCYINRQETNRKLPVTDHDWLISFGTQHPRLEFWDLRLHEFSAIDQIRVTAQCDVMVGVHGNGLTHALWMRPHRYVVELYWQFPFRYDYATTAQLMRHRYLAIQNGVVLDQRRIRNRDPALLGTGTVDPRLRRQPPPGSSALQHAGRQAIRDIVQQALEELQIQSPSSDETNTAK